MEVGDENTWFTECLQIPFNDNSIQKLTTIPLALSSSFQRVQNKCEWRTGR